MCLQVPIELRHGSKHGVNMDREFGCPSWSKWAKFMYKALDISYNHMTHWAFFHKWIFHWILNHQTLYTRFCVSGLLLNLIENYQSVVVLLHTYITYGVNRSFECIYKMETMWSQVYLPSNGLTWQAFFAWLIPLYLLTSQSFFEWNIYIITSLRQ